MDVVLSNLPFFLKGAIVSLQLTIVAMFFGVILGMGIAIIRMRGIRPLQWFAQFYVSIIRGTPILVQIFIAYYGFPDVGITLSPMTSAYIVLSINVSAYLSETFRGALLSVPKGQWEAASSLGLSPWQTFKRIILPQAARIAIPPMGNTFIGMLKETSLVSIVTVSDLLLRAQQVIAQYYGYTLLIYIEIAIMYWIMSIFFTAILNRIEARLAKAY